MLTNFRFAMEDPSGVKWDVATSIYNIFNESQQMGVDALVDAGRFHLLREIQDSTSIDLSSGSASLPNDFYKRVFLQNGDGDFIPVLEQPPSNIGIDSDFLRESKETSHAYIFGTKLYLQGAETGISSHIFGYIKTLTDISASVDPALSERVQELILLISQWKAWGIDRQFDRQNALAAQIKLEFGISVGAE